jgi:hypothetical protein
MLKRAAQYICAIVEHVQNYVLLKKVSLIMYFKVWAHVSIFKNYIHLTFLLVLSQFQQKLRRNARVPSAPEKCEIGHLCDTRVTQVACSSVIGRI